MADYWFKLNMDIFGNRKIKYLRRLPNGDSIALFWIALLSEARRCNSDGRVFLTETIPYTHEMLAEEFKFEESTVRSALDAFVMLDMISITNEFITIAGWEDHQNAEGLAKIREQNRIRQANFKKKQKLLQDNVTDNVTLTLGNATDIEEDKEKEEDKEIYKYIVSHLNEKAGTSYKSSSKKTQSLIKARMSDGFKLEDFKTVIDKKCADWIGDPKMEKYLRPETLFGTKFEGYLNERSNQHGQASGNSGTVRIGNYV